MLGPRQLCFGTTFLSLTLLHNMKYKELYYILPKTQIWVWIQGAPTPTWSLLARELRYSSRGYGMEHSKDSLWGLRKKGPLMTGGREPVLTVVG